MNIVILDGYTENPGDLSWKDFEELGLLKVYDFTPAHQIVSRISEADIVYTNKTPLTRETIASASHLRYIGVLATGYNVVDISAAREFGISVTNIPTYGATAVAQMVFALLLEVCQHVGHHNVVVQQGRWTNGRDFCFWDYPLIELAEKTMGIIGYGRIGKAVARIARAFGMQVLAYDAFATGNEITPLEEVLKRSDVISLHCPLVPETQNMINQRSIRWMKDGAILINTSRGSLINEYDLRDALLSGKLYAAACDVVSSEPISKDNPLLGLENCFITPHIAWAPKESRQRLMDIAVDNLRAFLVGRPINVVT